MYQDEKNHIDKISDDEALPMLMNQIYRPRNAEGMLKTMDYVSELIELVPMYRMGCNMDTEAAKVAFEGMQ